MHGVNPADPLTALGLRGKFIEVPCCMCGTRYEAYCRPGMTEADATEAVCSEACEQERWRAAKERARWEPFDAMLGENFAAPFDKARYKGSPEAVAEALAWRPSPDRPTLLLNGVTERGKTRIAVLVLRRSYERSGLLPTILWPGDLSAETAEAWSDVSAKALRERWSGPQVLLLDDLDKDKFTERTAEMLFAVLDARLRHGRPTIVTTNADEAAFLAKFPSVELGRAALRRIKKHATIITP